MRTSRQARPVRAEEKLPPDLTEPILTDSMGGMEGRLAGGAFFCWCWGCCASCRSSTRGLFLGGGGAYLTASPSAPLRCSSNRGCCCF